MGRSYEVYPSRTVNWAGSNSIGPTVVPERMSVPTFRTPLAPPAAPAGPPPNPLTGVIARPIPASATDRLAAMADVRMRRPVDLRMSPPNHPDRVQAIRGV